MSLCGREKLYLNRSINALTHSPVSSVCRYQIGNLPGPWKAPHPSKCHRIQSDHLRRTNINAFQQNPINSAVHKKKTKNMRTSEWEVVGGKTSDRFLVWRENSQWCARALLWFPQCGLFHLGGSSPSFAWLFWPARCPSEDPYRKQHKEIKFLLQETATNHPSYPHHHYPHLLFWMLHFPPAVAVGGTLDLIMHKITCARLNERLQKVCCCPSYYKFMILYLVLYLSQHFILKYQMKAVCSCCYSLILQTIWAKYTQFYLNVW